MSPQGRRSTARPSRRRDSSWPFRRRATQAASSRVAEEPQRLPPTEVRANREDRGPCDPRQGTGQEACRAQLAAKYAEMDKLCRSLSAAEFPTCIKSAYSAD